MHPPIKDQTDIGADDPTVDCSNLPDTARQEFKQDADINYMLSKLGVTPARNAPTYGEWDDSIDLQVALEATREARTAYADLPEELRRKFGSMEELLRAVENGSLDIKNEEAPPEQKTELQLAQERIDKLEQQQQTTASRQQEL